MLHRQIQDRALPTSDEIRQFINIISVATSFETISPIKLSYLLEKITAGDRFRDYVIKLQDEILELKHNKRLVKHVITGPIGGGKTHMRLYLQALLAKRQPKNIVISRFDLSDIREVYDSQYLIVKGLQPVEGGTYREVLKTAYEEIIKRFSDDQRVSQQTTSDFFTALLFYISDRVLPGTKDFRELIDILGHTSPGHKVSDQIQSFLREHQISRIVDELKTQASEQKNEFITNFLSLVQSPDTPNSKFDIIAQKMSQGGETILLDTIFRVLALAGYDTVVIFADEMETTASLEESSRRKVLKDLRDIHDKLGSAGLSTPDGYPAVALMLFAPPSMIEDGIKTEEPALYSRISNFIEKLLPPTANEVDFLIKGLHKLYLEAQIPISHTLDDAQVVQARLFIFKSLDDEAKPAMWREVVIRVTQYINANYKQVENRQR